MKDKKIRRIRNIVMILISLTLTMTPMLTVQNNTIVCAATKISKSKLTLIIGKKKQLSVSGTKKTIKWSTDNKKVAVVNSEGKVTAKATGKATITAKVGKKKYQCIVTVKPFKDDTYTTSTGYSFQLPEGWTTDESTTGETTYVMAEEGNSDASVFKVVIQDVLDSSLMSSKEYISYVKSQLKKSTFTKKYSDDYDVKLKVSSFNQTSKVSGGKTYIYTTYKFSALGSELFSMRICDCYAGDYLYEATVVQFADEDVNMKNVLNYFVKTLEGKE